MGNFVSYENAEDLVKGIKHDIVKDLVNNKGEFDDSIAYKVGDVVQYYSDPQTKLDRRLYKFISDDYEKGFVSKEWRGIESFYGNCIWTDGDNIYYSDRWSSNQYVLDKATSTWSHKTWNGYQTITGSYIWTDGENTYFSESSAQYVLDKGTSTWNEKTWNGLTSFDGTGIWTDGDNIYFSEGSKQYVLDKATSTWSTKTWSGTTWVYAKNVWTDGENIYNSNGSSQYVLDKSTSTWNPKTWSGLTEFYGNCIWTDGDNIYFSYNSDQYVLDKTTSTWNPKTWSGYASINGQYIWTDGDNIYQSGGNSSTQYILSPITTWNPSLVEEVTIEKLINDGDKGRPMTKKEFDALSEEEKAGLIHVTDEPDNPYNPYNNTGRHIRRTLTFTNGYSDINTNTDADIRGRATIGIFPTADANGLSYVLFPFNYGTGLLRIYGYQFPQNTSILDGTSIVVDIVIY